MQLRQRPHLGWMGSSPSSPLLLRAAGLVRKLGLRLAPLRARPVAARSPVAGRGRREPKTRPVGAGEDSCAFAGRRSDDGVRGSWCTVYTSVGTNPRQRTQNTRERRVMSLRGTVVKIVSRRYHSTTRSLVIHTPLRISLVSVYALRGSHIGTPCTRI